MMRCFFQFKEMDELGKSWDDVPSQLIPTNAID